MRKLARIEKIVEVNPIKGADRIEVATVGSIGGYAAVVAKGKFKAGDLCVYVECDAVVPKDNPEFSFLEKSNWRVKIIRLRGQISQGLVMPLSILGDAASCVSIGDDVTEQLGITLYVPKAVGMGTGSIVGAFPSGVGKTDESRLQSYMGCLEELRGKPYYITEKVNGSSGTYVARDGEFTVCSRNYTLSRTDNCAYHKVADRYKLAEWMMDLGDISIQGEVAGPGVQKNQLGLEELDLFVFKAKDLKTGHPLSFQELKALCEHYSLRMVKVLDEGDSFNYDLPALLKLADGKYDSGYPREGIVVRPMEPMRSETLGHGMLSFKVLNPLHELRED